MYIPYCICRVGEVPRGVYAGYERYPGWYIPWCICQVYPGGHTTPGYIPYLLHPGYTVYTLSGMVNVPVVALSAVTRPWAQ